MKECTPDSRKERRRIMKLDSTFFADFLFGGRADREDCKSTMNTTSWWWLTFLAFFRRSPGMSDGFSTFLLPEASPIAPILFILYDKVDNRISFTQKRKSYVDGFFLPQSVFPNIFRRCSSTWAQEIWVVKVSNGLIAKIKNVYSSSRRDERHWLAKTGLKLYLSDANVPSPPWTL